MLSYVLTELNWMCLNVKLCTELNWNECASVLSYVLTELNWTECALMLSYVLTELNWT